MQIVSIGDTLHDMSKPIFWEKYFKMLSAKIFTKDAELLIAGTDGYRKNINIFDI